MTAPPAARRIAVSGTSGFIGSTLVASLAADGHEVLRLVRPSSRSAARPGDIPWEPSAGQLDAARLEGVDAIVHLAGESLAARWTDARKRAIRASRVDGTRLLATTIATLRSPPHAFVCASAVGYYGDRGDEMLDESSPPGTGFLAEVARVWEAATEPARRSETRVVNTRFGLVMSPAGGALEKMLLPFRLGLGGRLGSGRQWVSWVSLEDLIAALRFAIEGPVRGPVNVTSPNPVRNEEFTRTLGYALGRPTPAAVPAFAIKLAFGEMGEATLLASQRAYPKVLEAAGFVFRHPALEEALKHEVARETGARVIS